MANSIILPAQISCVDSTNTMVMHAAGNQKKHRVSASWCSCREILSRRRGFICMTGAKPCPHCGLRVPTRLMRDIPSERRDR